MNFFKSLKQKLFPPEVRLVDPQFGDLLFMNVPKRPEESYWEGEWNFPPTESTIGISLPGDSQGPFAESREFYLSLPSKFEGVLKMVRPKLEKVYEDWLEKDLPQNIFDDLELTGFNLENPRSKPIQWEICFETKGDLPWLGIGIHFQGDELEDADAVVDT